MKGIKRAHQFCPRSFRFEQFVVCLGLFKQIAFPLSPGHRRTAFCVAFEIEKAAAKFGIERIVFVTLTFEDDVQDIREVQRRFKNLYRGVFRRRYGRMIGCWERTQIGRIHFHLVVVMPFDCQTGFDFDEVENKALPRKTRYRSVCKALRLEWAYLRRTLPKYGFGRAEMKPVKSSAEGIARYVGKYVSKHIDGREEADKGAKTVRFLNFALGERTCSSRFAWNTPNSRLWRVKVAEFARREGAKTMADLKMLFGPHWAFILADTIAGIEVNAEGVAQPPGEPEKVVYERPVPFVEVKTASPQVEAPEAQYRRKGAAWMRAHPEHLASPEYQAFLRSQFPRRDEFREPAPIARFLSVSP